MLRLSSRRCAALVAPATVCASAATGYQLVSRILGATNPGATNAAAFGEILSKSPSGKAAVYAYAGRAMVFLNRGDDKLAQYDVQNALKAAGSSGEATILLASLQYQIAARLLAEEQRKATISGATSEAQIATAVTHAKSALEALVAAAGTDYAVALAAGEFHLHSLGDASSALKHFETAIELATQNKIPSIAVAGKAEPWAIAAAAVEESTSELPPSYKSKSITVDSLVADAESLQALRASLGLGAELTDAQVTLLGSVFSVSARGGAVLDAVRTHSETFAASPMSHPQSVVRRVAQLTHPMVPDHHHHVAKPAHALFKEGVSISNLVQTCPAGTHILDHIEAKVGKEPQTEISANDHEFFKALQRINDATHEHVPNAPGAAASYYATLAADLMEQVIARATVGRAEALLALDRASESKKLLNDVLRTQRYVDDWRALLVKGRACRALGKVDAAEAAFAQLHSLKRQQGHNDIPLMDANRYKSAF